MSQRQDLPHAVRTALSCGLCLALAAASNFAQLDVCAGNGGGLDARLGTPASGTTVPLSLTGPPGASYFFVISDAAPPTAVPPYGVSCLDFASPSFLIAFSGNLPANGVYTLPLAIPATPMFDSFVAFGQGGAQVAAAPGGLAISPLVRFDFASADSFEAAGAIPAAVNYGSATPLDGDVVFIAGGKDGDLLQSTIGPNTLTYLWRANVRFATPGPVMTVPRFAHTATRLADGRVLLAGGAGSAPGFAAQNQCDVFDPATQAISPVAAMTHPRAGHAAHLLADGRVLVAGGVASLALALAAPPSMTAFGTARDDAELYDPVSNTWTPVANLMQAPRAFGGSAMRPDGTVALVSGICGTSLIAGTVPALYAATGSVFTDGFDPATSLFFPLPSITGVPLAAPQLTTLLDGRLWLTGGAGVAGVLTNPFASTVTRLFDGVQWTTGPSLPQGTAHHRAVLLDNGFVHLSGGSNKFVQESQPNTSSTTCLLYDGVTLQTAAPLTQGRSGHLIAPLSNGALCIVGGRFSPSTIAPPSPSVDVLTITHYVPTP